MILEHLWNHWRLATLKSKWICIATIADCITLETIHLSLVGYPDFHRRSTLKSNRLLVNCHPFSRQPNILGLLVQFVKELLDYPQRVLLLLLLWIIMVIGHGEVSAEHFVPKPPTCPPSCRSVVFIHALEYLSFPNNGLGSVLLNQYSHWGFGDRPFAKNRLINL